MRLPLRQTWQVRGTDIKLDDEARAAGGLKVTWYRKT